MNKTEILSKHCNLQDKVVSVVKEILFEQGRSGILSERIKKCLSKDKSCENKDCKYVSSGIGSSGSLDPFI